MNNFEKIIGGTETHREKSEQELEILSSQTNEELYGEYLVEPNEREAKIINDAVEYANRISKKYGSSREFSSERVALLEPGGVDKVTDGRIATGLSNNVEQTIAVDRCDIEPLMGKSVVHEMFHLNSFSSSKLDEEGVAHKYRDGINLFSEKGNGFEQTDEAIIAKLSKRFFEETVEKNPEYRETVQETGAIKKWILKFAEDYLYDEGIERTKTWVNDILILPNSKTVYKELYQSEKSDEDKYGFFFEMYNDDIKEGVILSERREERLNLDSVLDDIISRSEGKITDKEELFDDFARAHFTGNYLPLARKIENVLGKGSFRKIAGDSNYPESEEDTENHN